MKRADLTTRVSRLIQVEAALNQLTNQEDDLDAWLAKARVTAKIGLYRSLVNSAPPLEPAQSIAAALWPSQSVTITTQAQPEATPEPVAPSVSLPTIGAEGPAQSQAEVFAPPAGMPVAPYPQNVAPDFTLPQLSDEPLTLSDFRGKPTLVNFWATWCPPCRRELPTLQATYTRYSDKIGFIAVDLQESAETVAAFAKELGLTFPIVLDQDGSISHVSYEVRGIPTTIFVDANGVVTARHIGPLDEATIESYLAPLLGQGSTGAER